MLSGTKRTYNPIPEDKPVSDFEELSELSDSDFPDSDVPNRKYITLPNRQITRKKNIPSSNSSNSSIYTGSTGYTGPSEFDLSAHRDEQSIGSVSTSSGPNSIGSSDRSFVTDSSVSTSSYPSTSSKDGRTTRHRKKSRRGGKSRKNNKSKRRRHHK